MGSHSVTCHPTEMRIPPLPPAEAGTRFSDPEGMQGWVDLCYVKATGRKSQVQLPTAEPPRNTKSMSHHWLSIVYAITFLFLYCEQKIQQSTKLEYGIHWVELLYRNGKYTANVQQALNTVAKSRLVVKATSQSNGKGQILTPWGSKTLERISIKLGTYNRVAGMPTHANPCGAATTWVVWANT